MELNSFDRLVKSIHPQYQLLRTWPLTGGVSARVTGLEILTPEGGRKRWIVRQHGRNNRQANPRIAADEFKLLTVLQTAKIPAPAPVHFDESGAFFSSPVIVSEFVEGETEFSPQDTVQFLEKTATLLARIHTVKPAEFDLSFLPKNEGLSPRPGQMDATLQEERIRNHLEAVWPFPRSNPPTLLHGDFWPGNLVWQKGEIAAVIDWEDSAIGDPLSDVSNSRLEILWALGEEASEQFTRFYQSLNPIDFSSLPYWDLWAALRPASKLSTWGLAAETEARFRERHREFVERAFEQLSRKMG